MTAKKLKTITRRLSREVGAMAFGAPVTHVYNPLDYAWKPHASFIDRFGGGSKEVVLVGMNPGPFGMAQTGVPFGDPGFVRDWMGITGKVGKPPVEHEKRPVVGLDSERSEVSGTRLWGWAKERFGTAEAFFARFYVINYCPLVFMEETGRNRVPEKLPKAEREPLFEACDRALRDAIRVLSPQQVIGVGKFAEDCAKRVLADDDYPIGRILHPSPASPLANKGWAPQAEKQLAKLGVKL